MYLTFCGAYLSIFYRPQDFYLPQDKISSLLNPKYTTHFYHKIITRLIQRQIKYLQTQRIQEKLNIALTLLTAHDINTTAYYLTLIWPVVQQS